MSPSSGERGSGSFPIDATSTLHHYISHRRAGLHSKYREYGSEHLRVFTDVFWFMFSVYK